MAMEIRSNFGFPKVQGSVGKYKSIVVTPEQVRSAFINYAHTIIPQGISLPKILSKIGDITFLSGASITALRKIFPRTTGNLLMGKTKIADYVGAELMKTGIWAKIFIPISENIISKRALSKLISLISSADNMETVAEGLLCFNKIRDYGVSLYPGKFVLAKVLKECKKLSCYDKLIDALLINKSSDVYTTNHLAEILLMIKNNEI